MSALPQLRVGMYAGSWPQNIGNAFFDFGAEATIRIAFPTAEIFRTGGAVHWMFNNSSIFRQGSAGKISRKLLPHWNPISKNSFEISQFAELDLLVFAGMSMCEEFVINNGPSLRKANESGTRILGLGTGASQYNNREISKFSEFFNSLENSALITRDNQTYTNFKPFIKNIYPGIDSAFFLPEYFTAPDLSVKNFDVFTFDNESIPKNLLANRRRILYTHHNLWGRLPRKFTKTKDTLISDIPEDYLSLYANCETTYSDRVHACVASLAYGNKARLFSKSPRKYLFNEVGASEICEKVVQIDLEDLKLMKEKQVALVKKIIQAQ